MKEGVAQMHSQLDQALAKAMATLDTKPPCCHGCYHCCREPLFVSLSEVKHLLELLTPEKKAAVAERTREWLVAFKASKLDQEDEPPALKYRAFNLWCPLLDGTKCSVYERRPTGCRSHFAKDSKAGCEDDALREHQQFIVFEGLNEALFKWNAENLQDGDSEIYDSLGILLAKELLGEDHPTASRIELFLKDEKLTIVKYEKEDVK